MSSDKKAQAILVNITPNKPLCATQSQISLPGKSAQLSRSGPKSLIGTYQGTFLATKCWCILFNAMVPTL